MNLERFPRLRLLGEMIQLMLRKCIWRRLLEFYLIYLCFIPPPKKLLIY